MDMDMEKSARTEGSSEGRLATTRRWTVCRREARFGQGATFGPEQLRTAYCEGETWVTARGGSRRCIKSSFEPCYV